MTCFPGVEGLLAGAELSRDRVVLDGTVLTSRGPGTALEFGLALVGLLVDPATASKLAAEMLVAR